MRLLFTGLSGFIGSSILDNLTEEHEIYSFTRSDNTLPKVKNFRGDLLDANSIYRAVQTIQPEAIILMGAISSLYAVEENPLIGQLSNTTSVEHFIRAAQKQNINQLPPIIFFSTDLVYDGYDFPNESGFREIDPAKPKSRYGRSKLEAEHLLSFYKHSTSLRIAVTFGPPDHLDRGYLASIKRSIKQGETIHLFKDEWRTPLSVKDIATLLLKILSKNTNQQKTFNVSGDTRISRTEFGKRIIAQESKEYSNIATWNRNEKLIGKIRGMDCSMDNSHTKASLQMSFSKI